jgi:hypothetical protein
MSESLKMLRTKEGQTNAVFACFGSAAQHAQLFEEELRTFLASYQKLESKALKAEAAGAKVMKRDKKTMGVLLGEVGKHVRFHENRIDLKLQKALERRNFLMHHFFLERDEGFKTRNGRERLLRELVGIEEELDTVRGWIAGLRVAMEETISNPSKRKLGNDEGVLFSAEIELSDDLIGS